MITLLDYNSGKTHLYDSPELKENEDRNEVLENLITEKGHQLSNCEWMESADEVEDNRSNQEKNEMPITLLRQIKERLKRLVAYEGSLNDQQDELERMVDVIEEKEVSWDSQVSMVFQQQRSNNNN